LYYLILLVFPLFSFYGRAKIGKRFYPATMISNYFGSLNRLFSLGFPAKRQHDFMPRFRTRKSALLSGCPECRFSPEAPFPKKLNSPQYPAAFSVLPVTLNQNHVAYDPNLYALPPTYCSTQTGPNATG
jgi:hypothetical protein